MDIRGESGNRGISPVCPSCQEGDFALCSHLASGSLPPGQCIGVNNRTGGGFSEYLVAHRSQLFRVPETVSDEKAVLLDPLCVALHAVLISRPKPEHKVLVLGAGIIGLCVVQVIRAMNIGCKVYVDVTYDCVGSARTIQKSTCWANQRGEVALLGSSPPQRFEWSLLFWKEIDLVGSMSYGTETLQGRRRHALEIALEMIDQNRLRLEHIPVQTCRIADYRRALRDLLDKRNSRLVKAAFDFREGSVRGLETSPGDLTPHQGRDALSCGSTTPDRSGIPPRP